VLQEAERDSGWGIAPDPTGGNLTVPGAVLLTPNDKATERAALQRLKALAPLALFSEDKSRAAVAPRLTGNSWGASPPALRNDADKHSDNSRHGSPFCGLACWL